MTEVVLVRHGETTWSREGRHTGRTDIPLDDVGVGQAEAVGVALAERRFALVLTSPLQRARRTAEIAGYVDATVDADLVEWDYGAYEGLTSAEIQTRVGGDWTIFTDGVLPGSTPGETLAAVGVRADRVVARINASLGLGDVLVFSHGHLLRVLAARWIDAEPAFGAHLALGTATVSRLGTEHAVPVLLEWNRVPG